MPDAVTVNDQMVEALTLSVWDLHDAFEAGVRRIVDAVSSGQGGAGTDACAPRRAPSTEPARLPESAPTPDEEPPAPDPEPEPEAPRPPRKRAPRKRG